MTAYNFSLSGHTALVTGASRGIGASITEALSSAGARVILVARDRARLGVQCEKLQAQGAKVRPCVLDVTSERDVHAAAQKLRSHGLAPDILVNNAGIIERAAFLDSTTDGWTRVIQTNLTASYVLSRTFAGEMCHHEWGRIVNVASILALEGKACAHAYTASKHGLVGLTRALAADLGPRGITVNAICPGYVRTEINEALQKDASYDAKIRGITPIGRWGVPADIAGAAVFLASDAAGYITGHTLVIDGGLTATH